MHDIPEIKAHSGGLFQILRQYRRSQLLKFLLPTLLGILLFLTPVFVDGRITVMIAFIVDIINAVIKPIMVEGTVLVTVIPTIATVVVSLTTLKHNQNRFIQLFNPGPVWTLVRVTGAILMVMVYFQWGPEWIWHRDTGGVLLYDVGPVVVAICLLSSVLLPLLTDYGLMEFVGSLLSRAFERLFGLPGRSAVDSLASWLSSSSVGIILTTQQYRNGFYSMREACIISTNFSIVSLAYAYLLIKLIGLEQHFLIWYASVAITGFVCALIIPRLPPLSRKPHSYFPPEGQQQVQDRQTGESLLALGVRRAVERAEHAASPLELVKRGLHVGGDIIITIYPAMMVIGCTGLALVQFTDIVHILSLPLVPLLDLLALPEAEQAAPALLAGLIDSIMPSLLGAGIESEVTRFVLAGVAVNQIVFFTEVAIVLVRANIGLSLLDLVWIYLLRVLVSLPVLSLLGHLLLG